MSSYIQCSTVRTSGPLQGLDVFHRVQSQITGILAEAFRGVRFPTQPFPTRHRSSDSNDLTVVFHLRLAMASLAVVMGACSLNPVPTTPTIPQFSVSLTATGTIEGDTLIIDGTTDLPDNTIVMGLIVPIVKDPTPWPFSDFGPMTVTAGKFSSRVPVVYYRAGAITVHITFQTFAWVQPQEVINQYGAHGEYLAGENVSERGTSTQCRAADYEFTVTKRPSEATPNPELSTRSPS